jgi:hypothetical protein
VTLPPLSLRQNGNTLSRPGTESPSSGESAAKLASVSLRDTRIAQLVIGRMLDPGSGDLRTPVKPHEIGFFVRSTGSLIFRENYRFLTLHLVRSLV